MQGGGGAHSRRGLGLWPQAPGELLKSQRRGAPGRRNLTPPAPFTCTRLTSGTQAKSLRTRGREGARAWRRRQGASQPEKQGEGTP